MKEWLKSKENIKTKRNIIISIILIFSLWYYENYILVDNVFDYMYYSRAEQRLFINENEIETMEYEYYEPQNALQYVFSFIGNDISEIQVLSSDYYYFPIDELKQDDFIFVDSKYNENYFGTFMKPAHFKYSIEAADMRFSYWMYFESLENPGVYYNVGFKYYYKPHTNILYPQIEFYKNSKAAGFGGDEYTYEEIKVMLSEFNISVKKLEEIHQWFLYDRVLNDFFAYNKYKTRFSMENLGYFEIAELNTYFEDGFINTLK